MWKIVLPLGILIIVGVLAYNKLANRPVEADQAYITFADGLAEADYDKALTAAHGQAAYILNDLKERAAQGRPTSNAFESELVDETESEASSKYEVSVSTSYDIQSASMDNTGRGMDMVAVQTNERKHKISGETRVVHTKHEIKLHRVGETWKVADFYEEELEP